MPGIEAAKVVALLGVAGSGKSLVARRLLEEGFHRMRFTDPAREMLAAGFACSIHEIDGDDRDRPQRRFGGHGGQSLLNSLTNEWGRRGVHSDLWANEWRRRLDLWRKDHDGFVLVDDLQRPNEAFAVRDVGGIVVRVHRPGYIPAHQEQYFKQAKIRADLELTNEEPAKLRALTEQFILGLREKFASLAA